MKTSPGLGVLRGKFLFGRSLFVLVVVDGGAGVGKCALAAKAIVCLLFFPPMFCGLEVGGASDF